MRRAFVLLLLFSMLSVQAEDGLASAQSALDAGFPRVAVQKLEETYPDIRKGKAGAEETLLLARALLAADQADTAAAILQKKESSLGHSGNYWLAQSLAVLKKWNEALEQYRICANDPAFSLSHEALVGEARMLHNLDHPEEAAQLLAKAFEWPDSPARNLALLDLAELELARQDVKAARSTLDSVSLDGQAVKLRRDFLMAQYFSATGDDAGAIQFFSQITPLNSEMAIAIVIGQAEAHMRRGELPMAENLLEEFISAHPNVPGLEKVFAVLDRVYAMEPSASSSELKRWGDNNDGSLREKLAELYFARFESRQNRPERAIKLLDQAVRDAGDNPLVRDAAIELATVRLKEERPEDALALLPPLGQSPQADFVRGLALAATRKTSEAASAFLLAASQETLAESALFNAAICELLSRENQNNKAFKLLVQRFPQSPKIESFRLQKAFELARTRDPAAQGELEQLAKSKNPSISGPATLALAEWKYQQLDYAGARQELQRVSTQANIEPAREAALAVFLADTGDPGAEAPAIAAAEKFLQEHAGSPQEPEVLMKLGELLFRKGDFAAARIQLEKLSQTFPDSPLQEPALFLAAKATSRLLTPESSQDAMLLFEEVASMNGPFALRARFEQSILQNAAGKPKEALVILDRILASKPDADTKAAALIEKGKTFYTMGASDPASYHAAIEVWKQVANDSAASMEWRNQAFVRIGEAFEKLGDPDAAIASYYDAVQTEQGDTPEFFWFYKGGFAAARLLEDLKSWDEAVRIYEILSAKEGPRAEEARSRINKIRLENFLWDES